MSRLRNRMLKGDFWSDPDMLQWPRDKRWFYVGLRSLAEDSGCNEDSPFGWTCVLYCSPVDRDITVEQVAAWRDELIAEGKLIPYTAGGKRYLFQRTFHEHERPRNPQAPDLPLPPWVRWVPNAADGRKGSYEVDAAAVPEPTETCTSVVQPLYDGATTLPVLSCPVLSCPDHKSDTKEQVSLSSDAENATDVSSPTDAVDNVQECTDVEVIDGDSPSRDDASAEPGFADFWSAYPRRDGSRKRAETVWRRLPRCKRELALGVARIMGDLHARGYGPAKQYIPHASSFLNGEQWDGWRDGVPPAWDDGHGEAQREAALREEHLRRFAAERGLEYEPA